MIIFKNILKYNYYLHNKFKFYNVSHLRDEFKENYNTYICLNKMNYTSIFDYYTMKYKFDIFWHKNCKLHRENWIKEKTIISLPSIISTKPGLSAYPKKEEYHKYGKLHNNNGPSIIYFNGTEEWYKNGNLHRENSLPAIIYLNMYNQIDKEWYYNDRLHRGDGNPAVINSNGTQEWYENGIKISK